LGVLIEVARPVRIGLVVWDGGIVGVGVVIGIVSTNLTELIAALLLLVVVTRIVGEVDHAVLFASHVVRAVIEHAVGELVLIQELAAVRVVAIPEWIRLVVRL
jgi:hypothetical protein